MVVTDVSFGLWGDVPYFEYDCGPGGIVQVVAIPIMAYWMVRTLLWLLEVKL